MPDGNVSWTAFRDDGEIVPEIRDFVIYLEARHYAPSTVHHYARHVVRLGNYLASFGKTYSQLAPIDFDRFIPAIIHHGSQLDLSSSLNIIQLKATPSALSTSLYNQVLFGVKAFYEFYNMQQASIIFHESLPIRLTQTPTTCWVRPIAGVEFSVGRRLSPARDPQQ